jgi:N-acetyl-1-D-myo-inositol-2-amino-2-deoxy-alpha-D-glucopyranoside deacetylase
MRAAQMRTAQMRAAQTSSGSEFEAVESVDDLPFGVPDEQVTTEIDARDYLDAKLAAMRAHASQIAVDSPFFALSDGVGQRAFGREYYTLLAGPRGAGSGGHGWESDLFAGLQP